MRKRETRNEKNEKIPAASHDEAGRISKVKEQKRII